MKINPLTAVVLTRRAAFTLVEVIVAAAILGILMAVFFAGYTQSYFEMNTTRQDLRATQILTQKAEAVRLCTWTNLADLPISFKDYYTDNSSSSSGSTTYYGTISVGAATNIPNTVSYYDDIKLVTVSVVWTNQLRDQPVVHTREVQTLAAKNGMVNYIYGYVTLTNTP